jgi:hypothetical protein
MEKEELVRVIERTSFAIFLFSFLGGAYIVVNAWVHPSTLPLQLTHLTPWIREDTFGIICWIVSFFSFLFWNLIRK